MRYVAFVTPDYAGWLVLVPDFPDIVGKGLLLEDALRRARGELADRASILRMLRAPMPAPMSTSDLVAMPGYEHSMPAIISIPDPRSPAGGDVFRFG